MTHTFKVFHSVLLLAVVLVSCQKVDIPEMETNSLIRINPTASIHTKAAFAGTALPDERTLVMSAYHTPSSGTGSNYFTGTTFSKNGDVWTSDQTWPSSGTLDFLGYSADGLTVTPAWGTNASSSVTLTVPDNSTAQADILWGYAEDKSSGAPVGVTLRHSQAVLAFTASAEAVYDAAKNTGVTITGITVSTVRCSGKVAFTPSTTCTWSNLSTSKTLTLPGITSGYDVPATAMDITSNPFGIGNTGLVVIPQSATSVTVTYTTHNGRATNGSAIDITGLTKTISLSGNWDAGKKYVYNLEFGEDLVISASAYDWTLSGSTPVASTPSATYSVTAETTVTLPEAVAGSGSIIGIDWGDGSGDTESVTGDGTVVFSHTYSSAYTGVVKINVMEGSLDFGVVKARVFERFSVSDESAVQVMDDSKTEVVEITSSNNSYTIPSWARYVDIFLVNAGNAGTAGTSSAKAGKGGAGGNILTQENIPVEGLGTLSITIGQSTTTSGGKGGQTIVTYDGTSYKPAAQGDNSQTGAGSNGTAAPDWTGHSELFGAGGGAGATSGSAKAGGTTGGGKGGVRTYSGNTASTAGSFYGAGGGGGSYYSGTKTAAQSGGYQGIAIVRFKIAGSSSGSGNGVFSVNRTGKKVKFAPGNLYWDGSKYQFEEHQYDYPTTWSTSHVGYFYWSKTASVARAETYNDASASTSDTFFAADGGAIEGWTVLSANDWNYIIYNHMGKYCVSIAGKNCAVLVPDGVGAAVVADSYTAEQWADAEEEYGLVALPFAGLRLGTSFRNGGSYGYYWSATPYSSNSDNAYYAYFNSSSAGTYSSNRDYGQSVRLVAVQ